MSKQTIFANVSVKESLTVSEGKFIHCDDNAITSTSKIFGLYDQLSNIQTEIFSLETNHDSFTLQVSDLNHALNNIQEQTVDVFDGVNNLSQVDANIQSSMDSVNLTIVKAEMENANFQLSMNEVNLSITELIANNSMVNENLINITSDVSNLTITTTTMTTLLNDNVTTNLLSLQNDMNNITINIDVLKDENMDLQVAVNSLEVDVNNLQVVHENTENNVAELKSFVVSISALNDAKRFTNQILHNLTLTNVSYLDNMNFTDTVLIGSNFSQSILDNTNFTNADLSDVDFTDCNLYGATFLGSNKTNTVFSGAILYGVPEANYSLTVVDTLFGVNYRNNNSVVMSFDGQRFAQCDTWYPFVTIWEQKDEIWTAVGTSIHDNRCDRVSLNGNGKIVAYSNIYESNRRGQVYVYQETEAIWNRLGNDTDLLGSSINSDSGSSIKLSRDGYTIAIGANISLSSRGYVEVYNWNSNISKWELKGNQIVGPTAGERFGQKLDMDDDGNTLIVTTRNEKTFVFEYDGLQWNQKGTTLTNNIEAGEMHGGVAINKYGTRIAIGASRKNSREGAIYVYDWTGLDWTLRDTLTGISDSDFGFEVTMTGNGHTIVGYGPRYNNYDGLFRVYGYDGSHFQQIGTDSDLSIVSESGEQNQGIHFHMARDIPRLAHGSVTADFVRIAEVNVFFLHE